VAGGLAVASDGLLYLFGGQDGETILNDAYVYDPAQQQWQALPPLQQARAFAAGGALGGQLYVVGGSDGDGVLASCEVFSPVAQSWAPCPAMLQARAAAGAAVLHSKLYVIGGEGEERVTTGEVYDARQETWAEIPTPMLDDAAAGWPYLGVANVETRIYALGGMRAGALADDTFVYTPLSYQFFIPAASTGGEE
jgi:N-acetylneuraminic acid mutarotase